MYVFIFFWLGLLTAGSIDGAWSWWWLWVWLLGLFSFAAGVAFGCSLMSRLVVGWRV